MSGPRPDRGGWASLALVREAVRRLHLGYVALPRSTRRAWWRALALGFAATELLALALVAIARRLEAAGVLAGEPAVLVWLDTRSLVSFNSALWLEGIGNGFVLWMVVLLAAGVAAWRRQPLRCLAFLVGHTCAFLPVLTAWTVWDRARPTLIADGIGSPGGIFRSFPSGHMVQTVFAYGLLGSLWWSATRRPSERALVLLLCLLATSLVALGRLRLGAHWPSDVVAGAVIGAAWLAVVLRALRRAG